MRLKTVFVRFYKSFNYDYLRKNHPEAQPEPWDLIGTKFFPYVRIAIDPEVTTVVGANESGKSHLLTAIEKAVSGEGIKTEDICRYSEFFGVVEGDIRQPDFGLEWSGLSDDEQNKIRQLCDLPAAAIVNCFFLFRESGNVLTIYLPAHPTYTKHSVASGSLAGILPRTFMINSKVALPDSVPIHELIATAAPSGFLGRSDRSSIFDLLKGLQGRDSWFSTAQTVQANAAHIQPLLASLTKSIAPPTDMAAVKEKKRRIAQIQLARDLIIKVARIAPQALKDLQRALAQGNDGHANGIVEKINQALAARLNFPRFWVQDRDFSLIVSPRDHDLVFTIRDRTGTEYAFQERSSGLKYFLSYYIQHLAHETVLPETEILLMDEPDAYLSSQAQQDLLKIFAAYARPEGPQRPVQVIYVTHSPFLIDKNRADRIRVLEKGKGDEGTRVVRDVARNHYEPLRSAFGAFVGETTFIGNCNLMVEGISDQILLAGAASYLRSHGASDLETLDLNKITIVPAGSASQIPYLVYLARGRDIERPAIIVLLDSDQAGVEAKAELQRGGVRRRQLLKPEYVLQLGDLSEPEILRGQHTLVEIEDLIPVSLALKASKVFVESFWEIDPHSFDQITIDTLQPRLVPGVSLFDVLEQCFREINPHIQLNKTAFARSVIDGLPGLDGRTLFSNEEIAEFETKMKVLFRRLRRMQYLAEKELTMDRVEQKVERLKSSFLRDHPLQATKEQVTLLLQDIEESLDDRAESDSAKTVVSAIRRDFQISENLLTNIADYDKFRLRLEQLRYAGRQFSQEALSAENGASQ
jgi:energy-coupling factor transporter ATP-binding protein EcfA2